MITKSNSGYRGCVIKLVQTKPLTPPLGYAENIQYAFEVRRHGEVLGKVIAHERWDREALDQFGFPGAVATYALESEVDSLLASY